MRLRLPGLNTVERLLKKQTGQIVAQVTTDNLVLQSLSMAASRTDTSASYFGGQGHAKLSGKKRSLAISNGIR